MEKLNIAAIKPNEENPRFITDSKFKKLVKSIKDFPEMLEARPLVIDEDNVVLGGNMRLKALKAAGVFEIPVKRVEGWTAEQKKEFIIKDNLGYGEWDWELVANGWDAEQLEDWGLDIPSFDIEPEAEAVEDDYSEPDDLKVDVVLGDLIEIGQHRLLCGDSTDSDQVDKLMNGQKADMVFTDPPYGMFLDADYSKMINKEGVAGKKHNNIIGDHQRYEPSHIFRDFDYVDEIIIFGADYFCEFIPNKNDGSWLVWDKRVEAKYDKVIGSAFELAWSKKKRKREILRHEYSSWGARMEGATENGKPHPTMKPIAMLSDVINKTESKNIVDLFLGSGSTMVAAHQLDRKCYGMELDPKYCQVIIDRMAKLDETLNIKINGKPYKTKAD
jgi:DNA modification methylase